MNIRVIKNITAAFAIAFAGVFIGSIAVALAIKFIKAFII